LTITGTGFTYLQRTNVDPSGVAHETFFFAMDSVVQQVFPDTAVSHVVVVGKGPSSATLYTNDTYVDANGAILATNEDIFFGGSEGQLHKFDNQGNPYTFMELHNFSTSYAFVGAEDHGLLFGATNATNTFVSAGIYAYLESATTFHFVSGAGYVYGYAATDNDIAYHYDGSGPSFYVVSGIDYSYMTGTDQGRNFFNEGVGFRFNEGLALHGFQDTATFFDSPLSDTLQVGSYATFMSAFNADGSIAEYDGAQGSFGTVQAFSFSGGFDVAHKTDPNAEAILMGWLLL